ncbi:MAG TPA: ATP-binding protein [Caulobacteraceae bacterium]|jgi:PAS domain S-box-containing protein
MATKQRPGAERARLQAIRSVDLDEARPAFVRISRTAQRLTGAPFVHVSLVCSDDIWIAGVSAFVLPPVTRADSFVQHALASDEVMWVEDLSQDPRFENNPFVKGAARLRFYAGAPIVLPGGGGRIGALSVIDLEPRPFDPELVAALQDLAELVAMECDRLKAMKALAHRESEVRSANKVLEGLIDNAPVALVMTDRRLRVRQISQRFRAELGAGERDLTGASIWEVFPGSEARFGPALERALSGHALHSNRAQVLLPDGRESWIRVEITPWRDARGRIAGLLIMAHDITDMVEALDQAARSEQSLKLALEIGELTMWELDHRDRRAKGAGRVVTESYERRPLDYDDMSRDIWNGVHPGDRPKAVAAWERYERLGEPFREEFRMMQHNGPHFWVQAASEIIYDQYGQPERTVGVLRNIDNQRRSEQALGKALEAAESANRAKSEFLANMSHEIRTPLNGVMGVASALARTGLDGSQREMIGLIESSARTLESLLSDVLDLARVESGRMSLACEPFELTRCVSDVAALFQPSAEDKGLKLVVDPAPEIEGTFLGDAPRIRQIISNLVSNAVKFTGSGEVRICARALRTPEGVEARISVSDTGIGFDDEVKARLFGRFEQADGSITRRYGGTGLGLAISRSLAEQMGGGLDAVAMPGDGAVFTLTLSLPRAETPLSATARNDAYADDADVERPPMKVLLAEDHPTNRRVVELMLGALDVELTCVEDGAQAVDAWERGNFDLVLMDMQMPVMDGLTAVREIRAREAAAGRPRTQIHALTANAMPEHARASRDAGADDHLTKPFSAEQLFAALERAASATAQETPPQRLAS